MKINTENSNQRYDVIILINGIPVVQLELKSLQISPRRAMQQIVDYKNEAGNGYNNSLLCFMQLFIVSNRSNTYYFANNRNQHFSFNAEQTKNGWKILVKKEDEKSILNKIIYRENLHSDIKVLIKKYKSAIVGGEEFDKIRSENLKQNFRDKFNHL